MSNIQSQHTKEWTQRDAPLIWVQKIYIGDTVRMPKVIGFNFGGHYFESEKQITTFFMNSTVAEEAGRFGRTKYRDVIFIRSLLAHADKIEREINNAVKIFSSRELAQFDNAKLLKLLNYFFYWYSALIGVYRFTRPTFYESFLAAVKSRLPAPAEEQAIHLLKNDWPRLNFIPHANLKELFGELKRVGERRLALHHLYLQSFQESRILFTEIARRLGLDVNQVFNCTLEEIGQLFNRENVDMGDISRRLNYFKFVYRENDFVIITKRPADSSLGRVVLTGQVANQGHFIGRVKVIRESLHGVSIEEINKMNLGDVLVATSTSPDMMLAIKKAGAIITDAGGLLSHAAIVAREFNIPCIVGTGRATAVLSDGDKVEVDAARGEVRVIRN